MLILCGKHLKKGVYQEKVRLFLKRNFKGKEFCVMLKKLIKKVKDLPPEDKELILKVIVAIAALISAIKWW